MLTPHQNSQVPLYSSPLKQGLLLQFVLTEFIRCHDCLQDFLKYFEKSFDTSLTKRRCSELIRYWKQISGVPKRERFRLPWETNLGHLGKLEQYSYLLQLNDKKGLEPISKLHDYCCKAHRRSLQAFQLLEVWGPVEEITEWKDEVDWQILRVETHCRTLSRLIPTLVSLFHHDENVIFFLLCNKKDIQRALGSKILSNVTKDKESLEKHLIKRYSRRGFEDLIPTIQKKINE